MSIAKLIGCFFCFGYMLYLMGYGQKHVDVITYGCDKKSGAAKGDQPLDPGEHTRQQRRIS
jgi:hypothetical protein